jgi:hypothetical protein
MHDKDLFKNIKNFAETFLLNIPSTLYTGKGGKIQFKLKRNDPLEGCRTV